MANVEFKQVKKMGTTDIDPDMIQYTDNVNGQVWTVPRGNWIWLDIYEPWLAQGNTPEAAD